MNRAADPAGPRPVVALAVVAAAALAGCTGMSGVGGGTTYACKAPDGVSCDSVSGTYANALAHNLPGQRRPAAAAPGAMAASAAPADLARRPAATPTPTGRAATDPLLPGASTNRVPLASPTTPLRSPPRILRLWFKPWEDADRDLYDQGYVYVQIDGGQWMVEHAQRQIRDAHAPVRPPARGTTAPSEPAERPALPPAAAPRGPATWPGPATPVPRPTEAD